ncbi:MAG: NIPSNAP family protein [Adhaeribacter sp.]
MKNFFFSFLFLSSLLLVCKTTSYPSGTQTNATGSSSSGSSSNASSGPAVAASASLQQNPFYEMRIYYAAPGKLEDLNARFRNNTMRVFAKHGMVNVGYWMPIDNPENKIVYILAYPSRQARDESWKNFSSDPEWQAIAKASEANGRLVSKVETHYLELTDYSPAVQIEKKSPPRTFELRTYTASPNNIENLHDRFRNHTVKLFEKHGMTNIGYWRPTDRDKETKKDMLIYLLAHKDKPAGEASFAAFRADPVWVEARKASEVKGGGSLTTKVESVFMMPTDYSPIK